MGTQQMMLVLPGTPPAFVANAVDFDGTNDYTSIAGGLTGAVDGPLGLMSVWARKDANGINESLNYWSSGIGSVRVQFLAANNIRIHVENAAGTNVLNFDSTATINDNNWHNVQASWNTNFSAGNKLIKVAIDGTGDAGTVTDTQSAFNVDYTVSGIGYATTMPSGLRFNGCLAEFYFDTTTYLDVTNSTNNQLFRTASGKPVNLGPTGAGPTGSQPIIYFASAFGSVGVNSGSGGNFTIGGAPAACSTSPSS